MRTRSIRIGFLAIALWTASLHARPAPAQLLPDDPDGVRVAHVLLNVSYVDAQERFWREAFDAASVDAPSRGRNACKSLVLRRSHGVEDASLDTRQLSCP